MRIDKFLSNLQYGSRKEVHALIKDKQVKVNRVLVKKPNKNIDPSKDEISVRGIYVFYKENLLLMLNKPKGFVSANEENQKTVYDLLDEKYRKLDLKIAGRLDKETEGLLLLTNNGDLLHKIISPKKNVYKKYYVETITPFNISYLKTQYKIKDGNGKLYQPMEPVITKLSDTSFYLSIKEGKYHQIRRMIKHFDNEVVYLKRVSIGNLVLDNTLKTGEYKEIEGFTL